jgi:ketosteroid isomerase-like protein
MHSRLWNQVEPIFDRLAEGFSNGQSCTYGVLDAGVSGELGYVAAIERSMVGTRGSEPEALTLRVTTVLRRQGRHGRSFTATATPRTSPPASC